MYTKLREASGGLDEYVAQAELAIYSQNQQSEIQHEGKVSIPFDISIDSSKFGITDILILATGIIKVQYRVVNEQGQEEQREVSVDLSTAETEWAPAGFYGISELILSLTQEGGLAAAKIVYCYINPDRS